jgi:predicted dehydrogenase
MLEKEDLDIVSVCPRWVDCHVEMIVAALEAGCHVYSEKPMTATPEDADRIIDLADAKGLPYRRRPPGGVSPPDTRDQGNGR